MRAREAPVAEIRFGSVSEMADRELKVRRLQGREVGVIRLGDEFHAYENRCPHAGGPVCQGRLMSRVREPLDAQGRSLGLCFDKRDTNVVCPWHGYEFDVRSGAHQGDSSLRLRRFTVRVDGDDLWVYI
jgi:nitrite reductase (NADH) small subunit